jgi:hypothetical protein
VVAVKTHRRTVAAVADAGIRAAREVYTEVPSDVIRVAALVEIAGAAAALARTIVKLRHLDPDLIAPHVADRTDLRAVLGRGTWLPTITRHVSITDGPVDLGTLLAIVAPARPASRRLTRRRPAAGQSPLFVPGEVGTECR